MVHVHRDTAKTHNTLQVIWHLTDFGNAKQINIRGDNERIFLWKVNELFEHLPGKKKIKVKLISHTDFLCMPVNGY